MCCCALSAGAQWTEVKDVNGKVHTIYKTPPSRPSTPVPDRRNAPSGEPTAAEKPASSGGGGYAAGYNPASGTYSFKDIGDALTEGRRRVQNSGKYGFINESGKLVIPLEYTGAEPYSEGLAGVAQDHKYGFIDMEGKLVIPYQFDRVQSFTGGLAAVLQHGKWGFVDASGKLVVPCAYDRVGPNKGLICVQLDGKWGFVNQEGVLIVPCIYDQETYVSYDAIVVKLNGKYGYINRKGRALTPIKYDFAEHCFSTGMGWVTLNGKREYYAFKKKLYK
jgi:hypothetical protein